jgi:hypothetical protein
MAADAPNNNDNPKVLACCGGRTTLLNTKYRIVAAKNQSLELKDGGFGD